MISVRNLSKRRSEVATLRGVTVDIAAGETVAIIGASGGGKTTLLRCLNALEPFDEGSVHIAGHVLAPQGAGVTPGDLVRLRTDVGFVFQELHLFAHLTVIENVTLAPLVVRKQGRDEATRGALELLHRVGLAHRTTAYPHELSGGQKQRVAIVRALVQHPKVLLLDEPTSALDGDTAREVSGTITELTRGRITVVLVTHHEALANRMADRVLRLENGQLLPAGTRSELMA